MPYFNPVSESVLYQFIRGSFVPDASMHNLFGTNSNQVSILVNNPTLSTLFLYANQPISASNPDYVLQPVTSVVLDWELVGGLVTFAWSAAIFLTVNNSFTGGSGNITWTEIIYKPPV